MNDAMTVAELRAAKKVAEDKIEAAVREFVQTGIDVHDVHVSLHTIMGLDGKRQCESIEVRISCFLA